MHVFDKLFSPGTSLTILALAVAFMVLEYLLARLAFHDTETHDLRESAASVAIAMGQQGIKALEAGLVAIPFALAYNHRLLDFDASAPLAIAVLFVATEFFYYWQHRASHRIRWMWATHAVHHSPTRMNFSAAIRLGWTGTISGNFLFYLPLAWIGFNPLAVVAMLGANLFYQFFVHTELAPRLGPLEWVLNTPTHHRVHHASNASCLDRNYGGVLIVFDRLFGTFAEAPKSEPLRYGLVGVAPTLNPLRVALGEWGRMLADLRKARSLKECMTVLFAPPGTFNTPGKTPGDNPRAADPGKTNRSALPLHDAPLVPGE